MKVKELIAELQKYNGDREVLVSMERVSGKIKKIVKYKYEVIVYG